jgi:hypothetical protein
MEEEQIVNLGGVIPQIPSPSLNPGNQIPGSLQSPKEAFAELMQKNQFKGVQNIPVSSFYSGGQRYPETRPFSDFEEMAAQQQSGFDQIRFGLGKMVGIGATSFIGGVAGLVTGIGSSLYNKQFSKLWENPTTRYMDDLQKRMEDYMPNYYRQAETDAEWWQSDNLLTPNFWADKVFKNIGYGLGSIGGGVVWSKAFSMIAKSINLAKAGQSAQAAAAIQQAMQVVPKTQRLSAIENTLTSLSKNLQSQITNNGNRFLTSAMGTFGEASIESLQKANEFRDNAIAEFRRENGYSPTGDDLKDINEFAEKIGNYVWGMNTLLLTGTNYIQLPKILGSSKKMEKGLLNDIIQKEVGDEFVEQIPKTMFGRLASGLYTGVSRTLINSSEAFEEGMQFAISTGVEDFFNRAYTNREDFQDFFSTMYNAMGNVFGEGIEKTLNTKEGIESIIIGSLAGGIQQTPMRIMQEGFTGRGGQRKKNTDIALKELNATNIEESLKTQSNFLAVGVGSQSLRQQAIRNNDLLSEKDYERDYALSYLMPRAKYGKIDSVYNELDYYKQQAMTAEGFADLQSIGIAFQNESPAQFTQRVEGLRNVADAVQKHYDNINDTYAGIFQTDDKGKIVRDQKGNAIRKYNPVVIDKLVYAASKIDDYSLRIPQVNNSLINAGIITLPILQDILENKKPKGEAVKEALDTINNMDVIDDVKNNLKRDLSDIIELSLRRKLFIDQYNKVKNNPEIYSLFTPMEKLREMGTVEISQKEEDGKKIKKPFQIGKEYSLFEPLTIDNGKLVLAPKVTILSETLGGEFEVRLPDGREIYMSALDMAAYSLTEDVNDSPEFEQALDQAIDETLSSDKYKDINIPSVVKKSEFINSLNNQPLLKDILKRFNELAEKIIKERKDIKKAEEEIKKNKKKIKKQIDDQLPGDDVETLAPTLEELEKKAKDDTGETGFLPSANEFFIRSTTASEDVDFEEYEPNPAPHIVRSRIFLNNAEKFPNRDNLRGIPFTIKQSELIPGLDRVIRLSYGVTDEQYNSPDFDKAEFDKKINNVQTGFVGMLFVEQDPSTKEMFYVDEKGKRINKLGEEIDLTKVIFQSMPTTEVKYSNGSDRYRGPEKPQFLQNAVAWGAARNKMFKDSSANAYNFYVSRGIPLIEYGSDGRRVESAVGGLLATDNEIYSMKGLLEVVVKGFVTFQGRSLKMKRGTTILKNKDTLVYLNNSKFGRKKAESIYRVMKALVDEMIQSGKTGKEINLNPQYITFLKSVMFYKEGDVQSMGRFFIDLDNMDFIIGSIKFPIRDFSIYEKVIIDQLSETYHSVSNQNLTKFFEQPFYEYYYENGQLKEREWYNYQTYLLSGKDRSVDDIPLVTAVAKPSEGNPNSFLGKYAVLTDFNLGAKRVKKSDEKKKEPKLPKDKKGSKKGTEELDKKPTGEIDYSGEVPNLIEVAGIGEVEFLVTRDESGKLMFNLYNETNYKIIANFDDKRFEIIKKASIQAGYVTESETSRQAIMIPVLQSLVETQLENIQKEKKGESDLPSSSRPYGKTMGELFDAIIALNKGDSSRYKSLDVFQGFFVNFSGIDAKDEIRLEIKSITKEDEYYRVISRGKKGAKASEYNFLVDNEGDVKSITSTKGKTFSGEIYTTILYVEDWEDSNSKAALQNKLSSRSTPPPPPPPSGKTFDKDDDDFPFREIGSLDVERITPDDLVEFKKWHAEKLPKMPYGILESIYKSKDGIRAWGVFENGVAKFYKGAERGTEYHEIFEGIWASFLTPDEQEAILKEERNKRGYFVDRKSGKEILYLDATDKQLKERIADDFADFRLGKLPARNLSERIRRFFKAIVDFVMSFVRNPSLKEDLFNAIEAGKFKERSIPESVKVMAPEYKAIPGIDETTANMIIEDMIAETAVFLFGEEKSFLYNPNKITGAEVYTNIIAKYSKEGNNRYEVIGEEAFDDLYERMRGFFYSLGVTIPIEEAVEINNDEVTNRNYAPQPFETDWKKNAGFAIKFALATMIKRNAQGSIDKSVAELKGNTLKGFQLVPFGKTFADLLKTLSNSTIGEFSKRIINKASDNPTYKGLMNRLGGDSTKGTFSFEQFNTDDWRFYIQFFQTFAKQKPEIIIQYMDGDLVYSAEADTFSAVDRIVKDWMESMKQLSKDKSSVIKYDRKNKTYKIDTENKNYPKELPKNAFQQLEYLETIGVDFPKEVYDLLKSKPQRGQHKSDKDQFAEAVSTIYGYIGDKKDLGSLTTSVLDVNSSYVTLAKLYSKVTSIEEANVLTNVKGNMMQKYTENNYTSIFENEFNSSNNLKELFAKFPNLNELFSNSSVILKKGGRFFDPSGNRIKDLKVKVILGKIDLQEDKGDEISEIAIGQRASLEINQNLKGNYYVLVPADISTQWMMDVGNDIAFNDIVGERGWTKLYSIFEGYLKDEINTALDYSNRKELEHTRQKVGEKEYLGQQLRIFKDILPESVVKKVHEMILNESPVDDVLNYVKSHKTNDRSTFQLAVKGMIMSDVNNTFSLLKDNGQLTTLPTEENAEPRYSWKSLEVSDELRVEKKTFNKNDLSQTQIMQILTFVNVNYAIANIETEKILFGDPYQFKSVEDQLKRIKSFLGPRRTMFDSVELNNKLNDVGNKVDGVKIPVNDLFYHQFKDHTKTASLSDISIFSKAYPGVKINETDGFSIIMDNTFREVKIKNAEWPDQAEAWYQWNTAYARKKLSEKGIYTYPNESLRSVDEKILKKPQPDYKLEVLKSLVTGIKNNAKTTQLVIDKMSQMPIFYKAVEGTELEKLYIQMLKNKIGYVAYESARKVGVRGKHNLYDNLTKSFNEADYLPNSFEEISWSSYGIQVSNLYQDDKHQTRGSQITKIISMDMFANGQEAMKGALDLYEKNVKLLDKMHENAYNMLLKKLGIFDTGADFVAPDMVSVAELLTSEILKRDASENLKDSLELVDGQFKLRVEASTDYRKIKEIIYSLVHKAVVSPSMNGRPHVQVPATLWEGSAKDRQLIRKVGDKWVIVSRDEYESLTDEEKKKVYLSSSSLNFYTEENPYIEVLLPYFFKEKLVGPRKKFANDEELLKYLNNNEEGRSILTGVGFRIPTQAMSSIEVFKVKGFLDASMGYTVVVPSEITHKAGSDFDIDKLNMYLKSIYVDKDGYPRLAITKGTEEETKKFYSELYDVTIGLKLKNLLKTDGYRNKVLELFSYAYYSGDAVPRPIEEYLSEMPSKMVEFYYMHEESIKEIENEALELEMYQYDYFKDHVDKIEKLKGKLDDITLQKYLKEDYVNMMYKKSLENDYYDTMVKMVQLPDNLRRLLSPVDKAGLDVIAKDIKELMNDTTDNAKAKLINRDYLTKMRQVFVAGKRWIGIAAVNITGHSLAQKANLFLDSRLVNNIDAFSRSFLKVKVDENKQNVLSTFLPHNKIIVDGQEMISLAGRTTADGKNIFISDRLSGYATGFADIVKDSYIMSIVRHNAVVGTAMFLERIGAGDTTAYFLNQPIINEYLRYLNSVEAKGLFSNKNMDVLFEMFPTKNETLAIVSKSAEDKTIDASINHLRENISKYANKRSNAYMSDEFNAEQRVIFQEFLKVSKMAQQVFSFTQGYNYDTTRFKNVDSFLRKIFRTDKARTSNIINSIDSIFENSFIGEQKSFIEKLMNAMGAIFKLEHLKFRYVKDIAMEQYKESEYMSQDDYEKIAEKMGASYFDFIIQTNSDIAKKLEDLTMGENSVASQLPIIQQKHPYIKLLSELTIESSYRPEGAETIKLKVKPDLSTETNQYIGMMRELRELEPEFYNRLVKLAIIQGSYPSYVSLLNIVPNEDYAAIVNPIIEKLVPSDALDVFYKESMFQRQNWRDEKVVPTVKKMTYFSKDDYNSDDVIYSTNMFDSIPGEPVARRQILLLNPNYNLSDEVVKIPRIVSATVISNKVKSKELIDISRNKGITQGEIGKNRAKGLFTYDIYYGYKKVRYSNGEPLIDQDGNHVYKRINLYGDGMFASEYRLDKKASIFNNGSAPASYDVTKTKKFLADDKTIIQKKVVESVTELDDAQIIAAYEKKFGDKLPRESNQPTVANTGVRLVIDLSNEWSTDLNKRPVYSSAGINTMRSEVAKPDEHFGNPFSEGGYAGTIKVGSIGEAVDNYRDWLLGSKFQDVKPKQRQWILDQINQGKLDNARLLYSKKLADRGQGMHPTALIDVVKQLRSSTPTTPEQVVPTTPMVIAQPTVETSQATNSRQNPLIQAGVKLTDMYGNAGKDIKMASESTQFIGYKSGNATVSSTDKYRNAWGNRANTGSYTANDVVMVSGSGLFRGVIDAQIRQTFSEKYLPLLDAAISAGASFRVGNQYAKGNLSDRLIADYLQSNGYVEERLNGYSRWSKTIATTPEQVVPETPIVIEEQFKEARIIQVNQYEISVLPDGRMFFSNGKEVEDQTIKNKVNIRKELQDKTLRISTYNKSEYFVLSDGRILGSGKTNLGKETVTDPDIKKKILMKAVLYKKTC